MSFAPFLPAQLNRVYPVKFTPVTVYQVKFMIDSKAYLTGVPSGCSTGAANYSFLSFIFLRLLRLFAANPSFFFSRSDDTFLSGDVRRTNVRVSPCGSVANPSFFFFAYFAPFCG